MQPGPVQSDPTYQATKPPAGQAPKLAMISVDSIEVLNPRDRNQRVFDDIIANIRTLGLKKPITVTPRAPTATGEPHYLLICGEGRLKAYRNLGQREIPALVVQVSDEDALIMSLAENITRRQFRPMELLQAIERMREDGYDNKAISTKTGLSIDYINGITTLLSHGEERLLVAVEAGRLPISAAISIVGAGQSPEGVQAALQQAYDSGQLRGKQLIQARRLVERRQLLGSTIDRRLPRKRAEVTSSSLVRAYQREVSRQRELVRKADLAQSRLVFFVGAMRKLLDDEHFTTLLRAERLEGMPRFLMERITAAPGAA